MFCEFLCGFDEQYVVAAGCVCFVCCVFFVALTSSTYVGAAAVAVEAEAAESFRSAAVAALVTQF